MSKHNKQFKEELNHILMQNPLEDLSKTFQFIQVTTPIWQLVTIKIKLFEIAFDFCYNYTKF